MSKGCALMKVTFWALSGLLFPNDGEVGVGAARTLYGYEVGGLEKGYYDFENSIRGSKTVTQLIRS